MSRAFVDEDSERDGEAPEIKIPIPQGSRNYLTPEGADRLTRELHALVAEERPRILADLARATAGAAESDPEAVAALRRALGLLDRRVEYLARMSLLAEVLPRPPEGFDRVKFGARVRLLDQNGQESTFRIVGVDEAEPERGLIGWTAPLARALVGKRAGETATAKLPGGDKSFRILAID